ncbi:uncharacterized protein LOC111802260 [Cucurbita pepo subsp. pepo]|uniref:uncharacterized protein LOC111802260 n=1 Tax=Cucurbita pepo subsp. pepo TaxID=3664 RepID=UPI000C9D8AD4|nr:uncharacterized protein LOC111802260 [Cucurbita pepo subsp. pepo]
MPPMWMNSGKNNLPGRGFSTPSPSWKSRPFRSPQTAAFSERKRSTPNSVNKPDLFHVIHKVPSGDSPYVKAKQVQLIDKDPGKAVSLFWAAINAGDRVDSALKDMAVVMKQLDRSDEAIEAIRSFRHLCPYDAQESIDNVLIELYKRSGRIQEEIDMLQCKLKQIEEGTVFGGKRTKAARSQGKKVQITIEQEKSRVLGNLAWAFLQLDNVYVAEDYYRRALSLESDNNKKCNLAICLILTNRLVEAKFLLQSVRASSGGKPMEESYAKSFERASHMLAEKELKTGDDNSTVTTITSTARARPLSSVSSRVTASTMWTSDDNINDHIRDDHRHNYLCCNEKLVKSNSSIIPIKMKASYNQDESFNCSSLYSSPTRPRRNIEVPFTQPKNSFWEFDTRHQRQRKGTTTTNGSSSLVDDDACSESEGTRTTSNYKTKYKSTALIAAVELEVPFTQPRSCSWGINRGGCSRKATECFRGLPRSRKLSFEPRMNTENIQRSEHNEPQDLDDWKQNSCEDIEYEDVAMSYDRIVKEDDDQKIKKNSSTVGEKKSWADLVEEDDDDDDEREEDHTTEATSSSGGGRRVDCFGHWSSENEEEEFNDENLNSNILHKNNSPSNNQQVEDDSVDLVSSTNPAIRRPLYFDQQPMVDTTDNRRSSPFRAAMAGENVNLMRSSRLQVFQEITVHHQES